MAREAIQIETNRQLRKLNRTKGQQSGGPSARAMLAQMGTRVLTHELKELKRKAEVRVVAEKSERLEKKR